MELPQGDNQRVEFAAAMKGLLQELVEMDERERDRFRDLQSLTESRMDELERNVTRALDENLGLKGDSDAFETLVGRVEQLEDSLQDVSEKLDSILKELRKRPLS